jgi:N-acetyl-gamma-glutamyl-phosphate reductase common form
MIQVGVVGASGYAGSEAIRLLLGHPQVDLAMAVGRSRIGEALGELLPGLAGLTDLVIEAFDAEKLAAMDVVILALPHGVSSDLVPQLERAGVPRIVDLARDYRHAEGWVYGQPEWLGPALVGATRVAAPGCFATAIELAVAPLVAAGVVAGPIAVAAATGSSGSGAQASNATHHPTRFANFKGYKVLKHQHVPEVLGLLNAIKPTGTEELGVQLVPMSAPVDRGIFATCFVPLTGDVNIERVYADAYEARPLVRLRDESPELRYVRGTGFCDLAIHRDGETAVVLCAIDNLGRGAAAQGIQAMNLMFGFEETSGLLAAPLVA